MAEIVRPLSPIEHGLWFLDEAVPLNFVTIARISGPFDEARVRSALAALQRRHPLLGSRILGGNFVRDDGAVPLRIADGADDVVNAEAERELSQPFRASEEALARATVVRHSQQSWTVLLTLHHAIGDGMSGVYALRDLISALHAPERLSALPVDGAIDHRLTRAGGIMTAAALVGRGVWSAFRHGATALTLRRDDPSITVLARRPRLVHIELEPSRADALAARARQEHTTVHGALSAAMILSLLHDARSDSDKRILFGTPVNLRKELSPPVGESVGFFVSMLAFDAPVAPDTEFWELARQLRADVTTRLARGEAHTVVRMLPKMFSLVRGKRDPRDFALEWTRRVATTSGLTNLGRLEIETQHGPYRIETCHFAANPSALGEFLGTATSLHGRIHWNFVWPDPLITRAHADALISDIVHRLEGAVTSGPDPRASAPAP